jgi:hypothetical protein
VSPEARRERAIRAKLLLENGSTNEAFDEVEADITREWADALWPRTRERLHAELKGLRRVRQKLASMAGQAPRD